MIELSPALELLPSNGNGTRKKKIGRAGRERGRSPGVEPTSQGSVQVSLEAGVLLANTLHQSR